jgi:hypothetical protein
MERWAGAGNRTEAWDFYCRTVKLASVDITQCLKPGPREEVWVSSCALLGNTATATIAIAGSDRLRAASWPDAELPGRPWKALHRQQICQVKVQFLQGPIRLALPSAMLTTHLR